MKHESGHRMNGVVDEIWASEWVDGLLDLVLNWEIDQIYLRIFHDHVFDKCVHCSHFQYLPRVYTLYIDGSVFT